MAELQEEGGQSETRAGKLAHPMLVRKAAEAHYHVYLVMIVDLVSESISVTALNKTMFLNMLSLSLTIFDYLSSPCRIWGNSGYCQGSSVKSTAEEMPEV